MSDDVTRLTLATVDEDGDSFGSKNKRIDRATLRVEHRPLGPDRRVLVVETVDGWTYTFQRYGENEPWVRYQRERPSGDVMTGLSGVLPNAVEEFVEHVDEIDVDVQGAIDAAGPSGQAVADGGQEDDVDDGKVECQCGREVPEQLMDGGLCPACDLKRRNEERRAELSRRTTWVDDPHDPQGYGDRP